MSFFMDFWNQLNKIILSSSFHKISSKTTLLISFTGKKSGKTYTTPVNYTQAGKTVRITSQKTRNWWKNLKTNPDVILTLRGSRVNGIAEVLQDQPRVAEEIGEYLKPSPKIARYFNIATNPDGSFNETDLLKSSGQRVVIKVEITNTY